MGPDKLDLDLLPFLGLRDKEILAKLAELDGRSVTEEVKWLIRARAFGRLKDLGDDRVNPQVYEADLSEFLAVKSIRLERESPLSGFLNNPIPDHPTPK